MTYLAEFTTVSDFSELSELFQDDNRLAEAAVSPCKAVDGVCQSENSVGAWPTGMTRSELCQCRHIRPRYMSRPTMGSAQTRPTITSATTCRHCCFDAGVMAWAAPLSLVVIHELISMSCISWHTLRRYYCLLYLVLSL